jgi:hypothetical protein
LAEVWQWQSVPTNNRHAHPESRETELHTESSSTEQQRHGSQGRREATFDSASGFVHFPAKGRDIVFVEDLPFFQHTRSAANRSSIP